MDILICIVFYGLVLFFGILDIIIYSIKNRKQTDEWMKYVPNPFSNSKLSKDFWSLEKPINQEFIKQFELHNWDKKWLQDYVDATKLI